MSQTSPDEPRAKRLRTVTLVTIGVVVAITAGAGLLAMTTRHMSPTTTTSDGTTGNSPAADSSAQPGSASAQQGVEPPSAATMPGAQGAPGAQRAPGAQASEPTTDDQARQRELTEFSARQVPIIQEARFLAEQCVPDPSQCNWQRLQELLGQVVSIQPTSTIANEWMPVRARVDAARSSLNGLTTDALAPNVRGQLIEVEAALDETRRVLG